MPVFKSAFPAGFVDGFRFVVGFCDGFGFSAGLVFPLSSGFVVSSVLVFVSLPVLSVTFAST